MKHCGTFAISPLFVRWIDGTRVTKGAVERFRAQRPAIEVSFE